MTANTAQFAKRCIADAWDGGSLDGGSIQEIGVELGLLIQIPFDPEMHRDPNDCAEAGDPWFVFSDDFKAAFVAEATSRKFKLGDRVTKTKGSSWNGQVVGFYGTTLTPVGYVVESEREPGSCQLYPEAALEVARNTIGGDHA